MVDKGDPAMADKPAVSANAPAKQPKTRSPNYPTFNLETAIAKLTEAFGDMKRHPVGVEVAVKAMGFSYKSSTGRLALAAMRAFGLFENAGKGMVKISQRGLDIAVDYPAGAPERAKAIKEAALSPKVHGTLWNRYGDSMPADDEVRRYLIRDLKFGDGAVGPLIAEYKATIEFAKVGSGDKIPEHGGDDDEGDDVETATLEQNQKAKQKPMLPPPGIKEDIYTTSEGDFVLRWPENASEESVQEFEDWVKLMVRKIKRVSSSSSSGA